MLNEVTCNLILAWCLQVLKIEKQRLSYYFSHMSLAVDAAMNRLGDLNMEVPMHELTAEHGKRWLLERHARHLRSQHAEVAALLSDI